MAWQAIDRREPAADDADTPQLSEAVKEKIRAFFPRYPTKLAVLLPALHIVQDTYGHVSHRAMRDIAELLEIPPSQVLSTISFYTHYWRHEKGRKVIVVCRSLSCELMGARQVIDAIRHQLGIDEHGTTPDGEYSFVTEECLGVCEHAPAMLINEKLHGRVRPEDVPKILMDAANDRHGLPRSELYDGIQNRDREGANAGGKGPGVEDDAAASGSARGADVADG